MEDYTWIAEHVDGKVKWQENIDPFSMIMSFNKRGEVGYFSLVKNGQVKYVIKLGGKRKLIFFRRRMNHLSNKGQFQWTITCVGWEENVRGVSIKTLLYVYPNGGVELNNDEPTLAKDYHNKLISQFEGIQSVNNQFNEIRNI